MNAANRPLPTPATVVTRLAIAAPPAAVWRALMFYEQIEEPPPLLLRLLLPVPLRTEGPKAAPGDEALCLYRGGQLLKRVTRIEPAAHYGFEVTEQQLRIGRGLRLHGGSYALRTLADGHTELAVTTRYSGTRWPEWLFRPIESLVCHLFHRHLIRAIDRKARTSPDPGHAPEA